MTGWFIREEEPGDVAGIGRVTTAAFADHPHSVGVEPEIVAALRKNGDLALSLVAVGKGGPVIGHGAWSPARLSNGEDGWLTLGPVSVLPGRQRKGIGGALIRAGNARLRGEGAKGIVLLGDPAFYARFGFRRDTPLSLPGPLAGYFQVLPFVEDVPAAQVSFAPAFDLAAPP